MANQISPASISYKSVIDATSRYNQSAIIYYGDQRFITFETYKRKQYKPSAGDKFYVITKGTEYRPDLVSNRAYGTVGYWWKIMEVNNIFDIYDFKAGTTIVIPSVIT